MTKSGDSELAEPIAIRPTSETGSCVLFKIFDLFNRVFGFSCWSYDAAKEHKLQRKFMHLLFSIMISHEHSICSIKGGGRVLFSWYVFHIVIIIWYYRPSGSSKDKYICLICTLELSSFACD